MDIMYYTVILNLELISFIKALKCMYYFTKHLIVIHVFYLYLSLFFYFLCVRRGVVKGFSWRNHICYNISIHIQI